MNALKSFIEQAISGEDLTVEESGRAFHVMMNGGASPAQMAALLIALRMKGESVSELVGAAQTMRHKASHFDAPEAAIDTCGTGGDGLGTYNISTATAIVAAACGVPVVKHGNRSVSSKSGSSDVLSELNVNVNASAEKMQLALQQCGLCFLMAPAYHQAMRHVAPVRQELGLRTLFNLLGPLSNPAGVKRQLIGVFSANYLRPMAETLRELGSTDAMIVHGHSGLDEISLTGETQIAHLQHGEVKEYRISPEEVGLKCCDIKALQGGDAAENAEALELLLAGAQNPYRDIVCLNTTAALIVAGKTQSWQEGVELARQKIDDYSARNVLDQLILLTKEDMEASA